MCFVFDVSEMVDPGIAALMLILPTTVSTKKGKNPLLLLGFTNVPSSTLIFLNKLIF